MAVDNYLFFSRNVTRARELSVRAGEAINHGAVSHCHQTCSPCSIMFVRNGLLAPAEVTEIANLFHKYFTNMMFLFTFP